MRTAATEVDVLAMMRNASVEAPCFLIRGIANTTAKTT
jgi:hypothetical protein